MEASRDQSGETELVIESLRTADVFVDGGSNTGFFSMLAGQEGVACIAFEPQPLNFNLLLRNIERNGFKDIDAYKIALGRNRTRLQLWGGGEGASLESNWGGMKSTYSVEVEVDSLDNLIADRFLIEELFIKIDVEGHEYEALRGAGRLLSRSPSPVWLIEIGFKENFSGGINPDFLKIFELFWTQGYVAITADYERRPVERADIDRWIRNGIRDFGGVNYLFRRKNFFLP
jgi:FkbM family methyltransferase